MKCSWAVLGGFLLTATKSWAGVRGFHGATLFTVFVLWLLDRIAFWLPAGLPSFIPMVPHNGFLLLIVPLILWTLLTNLKKSRRITGTLFLACLSSCSART